MRPSDRTTTEYTYYMYVTKQREYISKTAVAVDTNKNRYPLLPMCVSLILYYTPPSKGPKHALTYPLTHWRYDRPPI